MIHFQKKKNIKKDFIIINLPISNQIIITHTQMNIIHENVQKRILKFLNYILHNS